jgi:hypothetical protein
VRENCLRGLPTSLNRPTSSAVSPAGPGRRPDGPAGHSGDAPDWHLVYQFGGSAKTVRPAAGRSGARSGFARQTAEKLAEFGKKAWK